MYEQEIAWISERMEAVDFPTPIRAFATTVFYAPKKEHNFFQVNLQHGWKT